VFGENWKDAVPLYAHIGEEVTRLGLLGATHATGPMDITLPGRIDRITISYHEDMLVDVKQ
jgi:hypothetical protein